MRHFSVPSPFHLRSVGLVFVHPVRRVHSPSRTAHVRRLAIISIKYAALIVFYKTAAITLMLDEGEKNTALSDKKKFKRMDDLVANRE
jgi:hypothetical protein